jgi:hypothetical protein
MKHPFYEPESTQDKSKDRRGVSTHLVVIGCLLMLALVAIVTRCA